MRTLGIYLLVVLQGDQREMSVRHAKETETEMKKRLSAQTAEHEDAVRRHLVFIDQVISD